MMHFVKMHGLGNDYVYMDGFTTALPADDEELKKLAVAVSDRHRGIGSDGLSSFCPLLLQTSECACSTATAANRKCAATAYVASDAML